MYKLHKSHRGDVKLARQQEKAVNETCQFITATDFLDTLHRAEADIDPSKAWTQFKGHGTTPDDVRVKCSQQSDGSMKIEKYNTNTGNPPGGMLLTRYRQAAIPGPRAEAVFKFGFRMKGYKFTVGAVFGDVTYETGNYYFKSYCGFDSESTKFILCYSTAGSYTAMSKLCAFETYRSEMTSTTFRDIGTSPNWDKGIINTIEFVISVSKSGSTTALRCNLFVNGALTNYDDTFVKSDYVDVSKVSPMIGITTSDGTAWVYLYGYWLTGA